MTGAVPPGLAGRQSFPIKQGPFGVRRTLEAGIAAQGRTLEANFQQKPQESLSRDGAADSLEPVFHLIAQVRR